MLNRIARYINENSMINISDKVIIAVSGGPDSICLLHILSSIKELYNMEIFVAHVNHCLRGVEADKDEAYVKSVCQSISIPFYCKRVDINKYAQENNLSSETAGREVRYAFFNELRQELKAHKVALAHNANDQAETVLMRLMRGTGMEGLKGIRPVRDGVFIRPILFLDRAEIENYCREYDLNPRIDMSNLEKIYNRNKIRLELIPYIQNNFNKDIITTLNRVASLVSKDSEFIEEFAESKYESYCMHKGDRVIIQAIAFCEKEAIITRIIRKSLFMLMDNLNNFESIHIYDIISLQKKGTGKKIMLPQNVIVENIYEDIHIYSSDNNTKKNECELQSFNIINRGALDNLKEIIEITVEHMDISVQLMLTSKDKKINFSEDSLTKYFDYDKIKSNITIRTRREGDKFIPYGMKGSKKLKDFFIDLKIPKDKREIIPLVCIGDEIAWVVGYRVSEVFKVCKDTKKVLEVKIIGRGNKQNDE